MLEIAIAVAIIGIIGGIVFSSLSSFRARKTLDASVETLLAAFSAAHLDTISSKNDLQYGVHIDADKVVYFIGPAYSAGAATNVTYRLHPAIEIVAVTLAGGGNDVLYNRLTGTTAQNGTFVVRARANPAIAVTITVHATGAVTF